MVLRLILLSFVLKAFLFSGEHASIFIEKDISTLPISNWEEPTFNDYMLIQRQLYRNLIVAGQKPISERGIFSDPNRKNGYYWILMRMGRLRFIDESAPFQTKFDNHKVVYFNNDKDNKKKCIVCYSSAPVINRSCPKIDNMIKALQRIQFDGHLIYRIGGWPNLKKGRLKYADVPYSMKPFSVEEARDMGYENILWLDISIVPIKSLNGVFEKIKENGFCFIQPTSKPLTQAELWGPKYVSDMLDLDLEIDAGFSYTPLLGGVLGFNVCHPIGTAILDLWIQAVEKKDALFTTQTDQTLLWVLSHYLGIYNRCALPQSYFTDGKAQCFEEINKKAFKSDAKFYLSYFFNDFPKKELIGNYMLDPSPRALQSLQMPQYIEKYFSQTEGNTPNRGSP